MSVLLLAAVLLPVTLYMLLSTSGVQNYVRNLASRELSTLLGADLSMGDVDIHPFNTVTVHDAVLALKGDTIVTAHTLSAGVQFFSFLRTGRVIIDYALLDDVAINLSRTEPGAPLNITPIIEALRSDKPRKENTIELKINNVSLRNASLRYDVLSVPVDSTGRFDSKHIAVSDLELNAFIPAIGSKLYRVHVDHLSFRERSGFELNTLRATAELGRGHLLLSNLDVRLPNSRINLAPVELAVSDIAQLPQALRTQNVSIATEDANFISPADLAAFVPAFANCPERLDLAFAVNGNPDTIRNLSLRASTRNSDALALTLIASATGLQQLDSMFVKLNRFKIEANGASLTRALGTLLPFKTQALLGRCGAVTCQLNGEGGLHAGNISAELFGTPGKIYVDADYTMPQLRRGTVKADIAIEDFALGLVTGNTNLGELTADIGGTLSFGHALSARASAVVSALRFRSYTYSGITASLNLEQSRRAEAELVVNDPNANIMLYGLYGRRDKVHTLTATASAMGVDFNALGLDPAHEGLRFAAKLNADVAASSLDDITGTVGIADIRWVDANDNGLKLNRVAVHADRSEAEPVITLNSDVARGSLHGNYTFSTLVPELRNQLAAFIPALVTPVKPSRKQRFGNNDFRFNFTLLPSQHVSDFFKLPVSVITDINIEGFVNSPHGKSALDIDAPYLVYATKLYENNSVHATLERGNGSLLASTTFPTKKGDTTADIFLNGDRDSITTSVGWSIERALPIAGKFSFATRFRSPLDKRSPGDLVPLDALVNVHPGTIVFGDEIWNIAPAKIDITPQNIGVSNFALTGTSQSIAIDGTAGLDRNDSLAVTLDRLSIAPIFETLDIPNAIINGRATGTLTARNLFTNEPRLTFPALHVDSIGYRYCIFGDADISARWDVADKAIRIDAEITSPEQRYSYINGAVFPMNEALDLSFKVDSVPVGFLKPFMVFTSQIGGYASGDAHLFGTFKDIDLEGDVKAHDFSIKVDFTGVTYSTSDSVIMRPGLLTIPSATIRDPEGNTGRLFGQLHHEAFHNPVFHFEINDAHGLLAYNTTSRDNPDWFGTLYTNGSAFIAGRPGIVEIGANMSTAPRSTFELVLSDRLDAEEYNFLTFRDLTPDSLRIPDPDVAANNTPPAVLAFRRKQTAAADVPSNYNMDLRLAVTPDATMSLVMDPVAGDRIVAHGDGNLRLAYNSANSDFNIWGKYTLADGSYRFTLQDIIIKDFTIDPGSEIKFDGDPNVVKTNIKAYYATNANLSDLDDSFLQDRDIARTNVPVHAVMSVTGDIRQPAIDFDLEFPTLTSDTYRKVRSIVSTEEMMNRQIIYLLALNRFYTPDYMSGATKGSELFSVASSTITGQLGNMLGKLTDKLSIAPNLRSDRGDFSDVEVDVALSSRLLNNRLIFNGNLGYRDKSLNSNQFIGDFDVEYLLNPRGTWRLKAYNRYNDRNYYLRSALTTQGVGIMFRRDFDSFLSFLRKIQTK